jgi:hypothetical protein
MRGMKTKVLRAMAAEDKRRERDEKREERRRRRLHRNRERRDATSTTMQAPGLGEGLLPPRAPVDPIAAR